MFLLMRAVVYATLFISVVLVFVPARLIAPFGSVPPLGRGAAEVAGMLMVIAGAALALWCILAFVAIGRGTPAPFDPPRRLVVRGPYQYVRNPMYVGAGVALCGAALAYRSWSVVVYVALLFVTVNAFVLFYEEPTLRRLFDGEYDAYCQRVPRWFPRRLSRERVHVP